MTIGERQYFSCTLVSHCISYFRCFVWSLWSEVLLPEDDRTDDGRLLVSYCWISRWLLVACHTPLVKICPNLHPSLWSFPSHVITWMNKQHCSIDQILRPLYIPNSITRLVCEITWFNMVNYGKLWYFLIKFPIFIQRTIYFSFVISWGAFVLCKCNMNSTVNIYFCFSLISESSASEIKKSRNKLSLVILAWFSVVKTMFYTSIFSRFFFNKTIVLQIQNFI